MFCQLIPASLEIQVSQKTLCVGILILFLLYFAPAWIHRRSRWLGITLTAQCQLVSLVCHPIQDLLLALSKHRKWRTKIRHEKSEGTIKLEYENPTKICLNRETGSHSRTPLKGQRPLKCDRKNKHICFAQLV